MEAEQNIEASNLELSQLRTSNLINKRLSSEEKANLNEAINNLNTLEFQNNKKYNWMSKKFKNIYKSLQMFKDVNP